MGSLHSLDLNQCAAGLFGGDNSMKDVGIALNLLCPLLSRSAIASHLGYMGRGDGASNV